MYLLVGLCNEVGDHFSVVAVQCRPTQWVLLLNALTIFVGANSVKAFAPAGYQRLS